MPIILIELHREMTYVLDDDLMISIHAQAINDIKPKLLELKVAESDNFFRLSDGFKKIFANDKKD